ncbi:MAG: hypothetical protein QE493_07080 [Verrucomicrobiae bacterium]|nr:hypothetical protein [Verrucomicrobiae bacterium]
MESSLLLRWSRVVMKGGGRNSYSPASQSFARLEVMDFARLLIL